MADPIRIQVVLNKGDSGASVVGDITSQIKSQLDDFGNQISTRFDTSISRMEQSMTRLGQLGAKSMIMITTQLDQVIARLEKVNSLSNSSSLGRGTRPGSGGGLSDMARMRFMGIEGNVNSEFAQNAADDAETRRRANLYAVQQAQLENLMGQRINAARAIRGGIARDVRATGQYSPVGFENYSNLGSSVGTGSISSDEVDALFNAIMRSDATSAAARTPDLSAAGQGSLAQMLMQTRLGAAVSFYGPRIPDNSSNAQALLGAELESSRAPTDFNPLYQAQYQSRTLNMWDADQAIGRGGYQQSGIGFSPFGAQINQYSNRFGSTASVDQETGQLTQTVSLMDKLSTGWSKFTGLVYRDKGVVSSGLSAMFAPLKAADALWTGIGNTAIRVSALIYSLQRIGGYAADTVIDPLKFILNSTDQSRQFENIISTATGGPTRAAGVDAALAGQLAGTPLTLAQLRSAAQSYATIPALNNRLQYGDTASIGQSIASYATTSAKLQTLAPQEDPQQTSKAIQEFLNGQYSPIRRSFGLDPNLISQSIGLSLDQLNTAELREKALKKYTDIFVSDDTFNRLTGLYSTQLQKFYDAFTVAGQKIGNSGVFDSVVKQFQGFSTDLLKYFDSKDFAHEAGEISASFEMLVTNVTAAGGKLVSGLSGVRGDASSVPAAAQLLTGAIGSMADASKSLPDMAEKLGTAFRELGQGISDLLSDIKANLPNGNEGIASTAWHAWGNQGLTAAMRTNPDIYQAETIRTLGDTLQRMYGFGGGLDASRVMVGTKPDPQMAAIHGWHQGEAVQTVPDYEIRPDPNSAAFTNATPDQKQMLDQILRIWYSGSGDLPFRYGTGSLGYGQASSALDLRAMIQSRLPGLGLGPTTAPSSTTQPSSPDEFTFLSGFANLRRQMTGVEGLQNYDKSDALGSFIKNSGNLLSSSADGNLFNNFDTIKKNFYSTLNNSSGSKDYLDSQDSVFGQQQQQFVKDLHDSVSDYVLTVSNLIKDAPPQAQESIIKTLMDGTESYAQNIADGLQKRGLSAGDLTLSGLPVRQQIGLFGQYSTASESSAETAAKYGRLDDNQRDLLLKGTYGNLLTQAQGVQANAQAKYDPNNLSSQIDLTNATNQVDELNFKILQIDDSLDTVGKAFKTFGSSVRDSLQSSVGDAIYDLESGMGNLGDVARSLAQSILKDFANMQAQILVNSLVGNLGQTQQSGQLGGGGGLFGAGIGGFITSLLGFGSPGIAAPSTSSTPLISGASAGGIPGRAIGGAMIGGQTYRVAEDRPELFMPRVSGTMIPNLGSGSGDVYIVNSPDEAFKMGMQRNKDTLVNLVSGEVLNGRTGRVLRKGR